MSYVSEAAELFISLNPDTPFLGPFDYLLIAEWEKQEIPLALVLDAIRRHSIGQEPVQHLTTLKDEIKENYANWLRQTNRPRSLRQRSQPVEQNAPQ
jgi:hypothetical protein